MKPIVDMSAWQLPEDIDYDALVAGSLGVILRAAHGISKDKQMEKHYAEINKRGGLVGFYQFIYGTLGMAEQVEAFGKAVDGKKWPLGVWADVESTAYSKFGREQLMEYLTEARKRIDPTIGIYTSRYMWDAMIGSSIEGDCRLWVANYGAKTPALPKTGGWKDWFLWQYTSKGKIPGVNVHLDLSWFNGSEEEFRKWTSGEGPAMSDLERLEMAIKNLCAILGVDVQKVLPG